MYELEHVPREEDGIVGPLTSDGSITGIRAVRSGSHTILSIFPEALHILQYYSCNYKTLPFRIAAASSADTSLVVQIGKAAMNIRLL